MVLNSDCWPDFDEFNFFVQKNKKKHLFCVLCICWSFIFKTFISISIFNGQFRNQLLVGVASISHLTMPFFDSTENIIFVVDSTDKSTIQLLQCSMIQCIRYNLSYQISPPLRGDFTISDTYLPQ